MGEFICTELKKGTNKEKLVAERRDGSMKQVVALHSSLW